MSKSSIAVRWLAATAMLFTSMANGAQSCVILDAAPDSHTVQSGDTLWDIAARFLQNPWCWRELWSANRKQIANPHWIYPGQRIILDRARGELRVMPEDAASTAVVKRSPTIRASATPTANANGIPVFDPKLLKIVSAYRLVSANTLADAPRIANPFAERRLLVPGDMVFASKPIPAGDTFDVMRVLPQLHDAEDREHASPSSLPLKRIGQVRRLANSLQQFLIVQADAELSDGDVLLPTTSKPDGGLSPLSSAPLDGKILAVMRDGHWAAQHDVIALNRGLLDGLRPGGVLDIMPNDRVLLDDSPSALSSRSIATLWVFEAMDHSALALIMRSRTVLSVGSLIKTQSRND